MKDKPEKKKPQTPREWALHRAKAACSIGAARLDKDNRQAALEYALYCALRAISEIALALEEGDAKNSVDACEKP